MDNSNKIGAQDHSLEGQPWIVHHRTSKTVLYSSVIQSARDPVPIPGDKNRRNSYGSVFGIVIVHGQCFLNTSRSSEKFGILSSLNLHVGVRPSTDWYRLFSETLV